MNNYPKASQFLDFHNKTATLSSPDVPVELDKDSIKSLSGALAEYDEVTIVSRVEIDQDVISDIKNNLVFKWLNKQSPYTEALRKYSRKDHSKQQFDGNPYFEQVTNKDLLNIEFAVMCSKPIAMYLENLANPSRIKVVSKAEKKKALIPLRQVIEHLDNSIYPVDFEEHRQISKTLDDLLNKASQNKPIYPERRDQYLPQREFISSLAVAFKDCHDKYYQSIVEEIVSIFIPDLEHRGIERAIHNLRKHENYSNTFRYF